MTTEQIRKERAERNKRLAQAAKLEKVRQQIKIEDIPIATIESAFGCNVGLKSKILQALGVPREGTSPSSEAVVTVASPAEVHLPKVRRIRRKNSREAAN